MLTFNEERLKTELLTLSLQKQMTFALLIVERMLPGLRRFSNETNFNLSIFLTTRDAIWNVVCENNFDDAGNLSSSNELKQATPDTEDFSNPLVSHALNTSLAIDSIIEFIGERRLDLIVEVASFARDSVDFSLSDLVRQRLTLNDVHDVQARIDAHPAMQRELQNQADDLKFLTELPKDLDEQSIDLVRERAKNQPDLLQDES